jgi:hypothetical protein
MANRVGITSSDKTLLVLFFRKERAFLYLLCAGLAACGSGTGTGQPAVTTTQATAVAQAVLDAAATDCPWPADVAQYDSTTLVARHDRAAAPDLGVLNSMNSGCAVLSFTVDEQGIVAKSNVIAEHPTGFGRIATDILSWNDYASGTPFSTFMVRLGAKKLADGGALVSLGFKDSSINLLVPASAGR